MLYSQKVEPRADFRILPKLYINKYTTGLDSLNSTYIFTGKKFNVGTLPFFCKMEHKLSAKAKIPVRIRLGSLDYVNRLEGKGH